MWTNLEALPNISFNFKDAMGPYTKIFLRFYGPVPKYPPPPNFSHGSWVVCVALSPARGSLWHKPLTHRVGLATCLAGVGHTPIPSHPPNFSPPTKPPQNLPPVVPLPAGENELVVHLTSAASAPWSPPRAGAGDAAHKVFHKTAQFGGCSPPPMGGMVDGAFV